MFSSLAPAYTHINNASLSHGKVPVSRKDIIVISFHFSRNNPFILTCFLIIDMLAIYLNYNYSTIGIVLNFEGVRVRGPLLEKV